MSSTHANSYDDLWHPRQVQECVNMWELTEDETNKLMQFKESVADVDHWMNSPFDLVRFLKTPLCQGNVKTMEKRFRRCIQWRLEHHVDTILQDYLPPLLYNYSPFAVMEGCDKEGDNVLVGRIGGSDNLGLLHRFGREEAIQTFLWYYELQTRGPWQKDRKERPKMFLVVHDLKGLDWSQLHPSLVSLSQELIHLEQTLHPHWAKKALIVNCPPIISVFWSIFKHIIPQHVREMIEFATEAHTEEVVSKFVDVCVLPKEVLPGLGKGTAVRDYEPVWEGGMLPPPSDDDRKRRSPIIIDGDRNEDVHCKALKETKVLAKVLMQGEWDGDEIELTC